jgi:hypothetical protein
LLDRNGEVTAAGMDYIIKENGRVALHLTPSSAGLNPTKLVYGYVKNRIASTDLKEMQMFFEMVFP